LERGEKNKGKRLESKKNKVRKVKAKKELESTAYLNRKSKKNTFFYGYESRRKVKEKRDHKREGKGKKKKDRLPSSLSTKKKGIREK